MKRTDCECTQEGWCERHQCLKGRGMFLLCQRSTQAFERWEMGQGSGQDSKHPKLEILKAPCIYRDIDPIDEVPCELCGAKQKMVPVFACRKHTECTVMPTGGRSQRTESLASCLRCDSYEAARANA